MKQESLKKLERVINLIESSDLSSKELLISELKQVIFFETANCKSKFNLYDFTSKDNIRPAMTGVYHENGLKIATDGYILCVIKEQYAPELEGKVIDKFGVEIECKFPNWKRVIPTYRDNELVININEFNDLYKQYKVDVKLGNDVESIFKIIKNDFSIYFKYKLFAKFTTFLSKFQQAKIYYRDNQRCIIAIYEEHICVLNPCAPVEDTISVLQSK